MDGVVSGPCVPIVLLSFPGPVVKPTDETNRLERRDDANLMAESDTRCTRVFWQSAVSVGGQGCGRTEEEEMVK